MNAALEARIGAALATVVDPEMGRDLVALGLIYATEAAPGGTVRITMTTTTRGCPLAGILKEMVAVAVAAVEGVSAVEVVLTYEPAWTPAMIRAD